MKRLESGQFRFTTTDLTNHLRCADLTYLNQAVERGPLSKQSFRDETHDLIETAASVRAQQYLRDLLIEGRRIARIEHRDVSQEQMVRATTTAMRSGAEIIYRPAFTTGSWSGAADFLFRVDNRATDLGDWGYEVFAVASPTGQHGLSTVEALTLADASAHVAAIQGAEPDCAHLVVHAGRVFTMALRDIAPWFRAVRADFLQLIETPSPGGADVTAHCASCGWLNHCESVRGQSDDPPARPHLHPSQFVPAMFPDAATADGDDPLTTEIRELGLDIEALVPEFRGERNNEQHALWTLAQLLNTSATNVPAGRAGRVVSIDRSLVWLAKAALMGRLVAVARVQPLAASLLRRSPQFPPTDSVADPRTTEPLSPADAAEATARHQARTLAGNFMTVCGAPGTGKTTAAAKVACDLAERGDLVGVTAPTEQLVVNLMRAVRNESRSRGQVLRFGAAPSGADANGALNGSLPDNDYADTIHFEDAAALDAAVAEGMIDVVAGPPAYFARESCRAMFTSLLVDEAGDVTLRTAIAMTPATRNLVLVGTPNGGHGAGTVETEQFDAGQSVLDHLGARLHSDGGRFGVTLPAVRRMHPAIANYVASQFLGATVTVDPDAARQWLDPAGVGLRFDAVTTPAANPTAFDFEDPITQIVAEVVGQKWTDADGHTRPLKLSDVLVISPDPEQVAVLRSAIGTAVRVGVPQDFAGEHAPVVICGLPADDGSSSFTAEDLYVAVSRAQGLAVIVAPETLLSIAVDDVADLARTSALLHLVEVASFSTDAQKEIDQLVSGPGHSRVE